jgi:hypothetical protein
MTQEQPTQVTPRVQYYPAVEQPPRKKRGCLGCIGRLFVVTLLLIAIILFAGVGLAGTLLYSNLSQEIEEGWLS